MNKKKIKVLYKRENGKFTKRTVDGNVTFFNKTVFWNSKYMNKTVYYTGP